MNLKRTKLPGVAVYRGGVQNTKSHFLRQEQPYPNPTDTVVFNYFCYKGVAGIIFPTQVIEQRRSNHWTTLKRNKGTWTK